MAASKPYQDPEKLYELYHGKGLTTREIAEKMNCTNPTISRYLNKYGIETRENWKAGVKKAAEVNREESVTLRQLPTGYKYWASKEWDEDKNKRTNKIVYVHRLLAVAKYGFDAVADLDVHHKNGHKWDNRPYNIELKDKGDHAGEHNEKGREMVSDGIRYSGFFELDGFQRIVATEVAKHNGQTIGQLQSNLEQYYDTVCTGRLKRTMTELVDKGFVEKGASDRQAVEYRIAIRGKRELERHVEWLKGNDQAITAD